MLDQVTITPAAERRRWLPRWNWHNLVRVLGRVRQMLRAPVTGRSPAEAQRLIRAERRGLQLAILCRTGLFAFALVYYVGSLWVSGLAPTAHGIAALIALTLLGALHFVVIGTRFDRPWLKFVAVAVDMIVISALFVVLPVSSTSDIPQIYAFRSTSGGMLAPFIALATLSLSPRLTLWAGAIAATAYLAAFRLVASGIENPLSWSDIPRGASLAQYEAVYFSENFIGSGTRYTEAVVLMVIAAILAVAVARARRVFYAQIEAEAARTVEREQREEITRRLGRFVPAAVAARLIEDPSALAPQVRSGAALVMDVADFTAFAEPRDPAEVIAELNRFLASCAAAVSEVNGVVIAFTGDGLLATFNTPLEVAEPKLAALRAARNLMACGEPHGFRLRVGIAAGPIAAGSIGSPERQAFTVYGNTVNRAARLEMLAKSLGETILVDRTCAEALQSAGERVEALGEHVLQGFADPVRVWRAR